MDWNLIWLKIWVNFVWTSGQRLLRRGHPAEKYARGLVFFFFFFFFAFYWVYFLVFPFHSFNFFSWLSSFIWPPIWPVCIEEKTYDGNSRAMLKTWNVNCIFLCLNLFYYALDADIYDLAEIEKFRFLQSTEIMFKYIRKHYIIAICIQVDHRTRLKTMCWLMQ